MYKTLFKRCVDFSIAVAACVVTFPLLCVVIVLLAIANKGKVFFIQERPGLHGRLFFIVKFKTMNDETDAEGNLLSDVVRLTVVGKWVRKLSLDEIPQLLNVIRGDMSLIGPRPLLVEYLPLYSKEQSKRHTVRPGITGWAQVNGRNAIDWDTKFKLDVYYVENISIALDLKILWMTVMKVLKSEGISSGTSVTMEKFKGQQ
jgi:lipopolysaccharide/colanic/teichoic acid biosynthesis glycosyltransferase